MDERPLRNVLMDIQKGENHMASVEKFTIYAVVNQLRHIERTIANPSNEDIDQTKENKNYSLAPDRGMSSYDYFKERKSKLYCYGRDDVKVMAGWVVTAPKDLPADQHRAFFERTHDFLIERYGESNCIQSIVHNDESGQPHLHYCFIPAVPDKKHGGEKICANDVINPKELRNFHSDLQKYLKDNGINANVHSGITKAQGGNRSVREMKQERRLHLEHERTIERVDTTGGTRWR